MYGSVNLKAEAWKTVDFFFFLYSFHFIKNHVTGVTRQIAAVILHELILSKKLERFLNLLVFAQACPDFFAYYE